MERELFWKMCLYTMLQWEPAYQGPNDLHSGLVVAAVVALMSAESKHVLAFYRPDPPTLRAASCRRQRTNCGAD